MANDTLDVLNVKSLLFLKNSLPGNICWTIFGFTGCLLNACVLIVVRKTKELHTSGVYNMINLAMSDFLFCLVHGILGARSMIYYLVRKPLVEPAVYCWIFNASLQLFTAQANKLICLFIALDRFAAVVFPIWFRQRSMVPIVVSCVTPWLIAAGRTIAIAFNLKGVEVVHFCGSDAVVKKSFMKAFVSAPSVAILTITVVVYALLIAKVATKMFQVRKNAQALKDYKDLIEFRMIKSLAIILAIYAVTTQLTTFINQQSRVKGYNYQLIIPMMKSFWVLNSMVTFCIYLMTNSVFKKGFKTIFMSKKAKVGQVSQTQPVVTL